ncbi:MAG: hypothetical protein ACO1RT_12605 [Planctomycetaceae bacterium]
MSRITVPLPTHGRAPSHSPPDVHYAPGIEMARCLGWFSIGLGLAEMLLPKEMGRLTGVHHPSLLKVFGLREVVTGIGILSSTQPAMWMWGRVLGDVLDLAVISESAVDQDEDHRRRAMAAGLAVAGVMAADAITASSLSAAAKVEG